jgi:2-keto-4-pentenoate hydratase/2-oxohepta-3-ene-1,7-dioic acid hydratase in catechol pathway
MNTTVNVFNDVRNIFCVGRNYTEHAHELGNAIPEQPMLFSKPTHSLAYAQGILSLPTDLGEIHYETEMVIHIKETYEPDKSLSDIIAAVGVGIDFTARETQSELKKKGKPWLLAKGFPGAALLSDFIPYQDENWFNALTFSLQVNNKIVQQDSPSSMIFPLHTQIEYISKHFGLGAGDLIYTGTPAGVGPIHSGDTLTLHLTEPDGTQHHSQPVKINM